MALSRPHNPQERALQPHGRQRMQGAAPEPTKTLLSPTLRHLPMSLGEILSRAMWLRRPLPGAAVLEMEEENTRENRLRTADHPHVLNRGVAAKI